MAEEKEHYEYVRARICCGELSWEYQIKTPGAPQGRMSHDEDVSDYTDDDIKQLTRDMLDCPDDQEIEVIWE